MILSILNFFRRNKSNFRDDQTTAQSNLNSNETTHPPQNIRRYYFNYKIFKSNFSCLFIICSNYKLN